ncbi:MAG: T9SS type A sorting domain-containing protein [Bacteroidales bacterium]|nr:T9SS type A sorting domain-containing protein [Bacteroidales bacterium]
MKKYKLIILMCLCFKISFCQNISFEWLKLIGQEGVNELKCMVIDSNSNIIVGGFFENTICIDENIINSNGNKDLLLAKYDSLGNNIWVFHGGGELDDYISDISLSNNRIFILGVFSDTLFLENDVYIADSLNDVFIGELKNDKIYGIDKFSGKGLVSTEELFTDNENLYITGGYKGELILESDTLLSTGYWDHWLLYDSVYVYNEHMFLIKYNLQDKIKWYKNYYNARSLALSKDNLDNIYLIALQHFGICIIEDNIEVHNNLFMIKYDNNGNYLWHITGGPSGKVIQPYDLSYSNNYLYITGHIAGDNLYIGNETVVDTSWYDAFICKMDTSGSLIWFNQIGNGNWHNSTEHHDNFGNTICIKNDTITIAGHFLEEIDFGSTILNSCGESEHDLFYAKYENDGSFIEAGQYIVPGWSSANDIVFDDLGNIYIAGYSYENNTYDFEPQFMLLGKIDSLTLIDDSDNVLYRQNSIEIFPNPSETFIQLKFDYESHRFFNIMDIKGNVVLETESVGKEIRIDLSSLNNGLYFIIIRENNTITNLKFIKLKNSQ